MSLDYLTLYVFWNRVFLGEFVTVGDKAGFLSDIVENSISLFNWEVFYWGVVALFFIATSSVMFPLTGAEPVAIYMVVAI